MRVEKARRVLLRTGNPFPFIEAQWPGVYLDEFQRDMLENLFSPRVREIYVKGCTASGKTAAAGLGICAYFDAYQDARVVLTASTFEHVSAVLFGEVSRWFKLMAFPHPEARLLGEQVAHHKGHYIVCVNPGDGEAFSGRHGRHTLFAFDESTAVKDARFALADTQATKFLAMANPRTISGRFRLGYSLCQDPNQNETVLGRYGYRRCLTIDGADVLNVRERRLENPIAPKCGIEVNGRFYRQGEMLSEDDYEAVKPLVPGQLCLDTYLGHCDDPDQRWANCFAHGRFPDEDPQIQVIMSSWFDRPNGPFEAWAKSKPAVTAFALDPADSEFGDSTMLAAGGSEGLAALHDRRHEGAMETVAWVLMTAESEYGIDLKRGEVPLVIDMGGMGKAWFSRFKELGVRVVPYDGNDPAEDKRHYVNRRAEGYGVLGARLDPKGVWANVAWAMPPDAQMVQDLCAPEKIYDSDGFRFKLTPKSRRPGMPEKSHTLHEKLGRSPDRGDAVVMLYWGIHSGGSMATTAISRWKIQSAVKWDGPADEQNRGCHAIIAGVYEDRRFNTAGLCILGVNYKERMIDLLRLESWKDLSARELAEKMKPICERHKVWGLALNTAASAALAEQLDQMGAPVNDSPFATADRDELAQTLVDSFERKLVRIYRNEQLVSQISALPIEYSLAGSSIGDPEDGCPALEQGMAFAIAMVWAMGNLKEKLGE